MEEEKEGHEWLRSHAGWKKIRAGKGRLQHFVSGRPVTRTTDDDWQLLGRLYQYPTIHNTSSSHRTNQHFLSYFILLSPEIFRYTYRSGCRSRSFVLFTCISATTQTSSSGTFLFPESCTNRSFIYFIASITYSTIFD